MTILETQVCVNISYKICDNICDNIFKTCAMKYVTIWPETLKKISTSCKASKTNIYLSTHSNSKYKYIYWF